jgi:hypothetical protein
VESNRIRKKRGQGGIEFITTYGWAILVVVISLTALIYFDVFSIGDVAPNKCILPTGIICLDSSISSTNGITLSIANGMKKQLHSFNITVPACGTNIASSSEDILRDSETEIYKINCTESLLVSNLFSSDVEIIYLIGNNPNTRLTKQVKGIISGTIEE